MIHYGLSFPCSRHSQLWPMIMAEMQDMTIERRRIANELSHTSSVAVKEQEQEEKEEEDWTYDCDTLAAFLDHAKA